MTEKLEIWHQESVQQHRILAMREAASRFLHNLQSLVPDQDDDDDHQAGSPIEAIFHIWFDALRMAESQGWFPDDYEFSLSPQDEVKIGNDLVYRLDFAVLPNDPERFLLIGKTFPKIGVELDGHEFHERTPQQVAYRNKRDRDLQQADWKIFHFSGREVLRHPARCADEVIDYSAKQMNALLIELGRHLRSQLR